MVCISKVQGRPRQQKTSKTANHYTKASIFRVCMLCLVWPSGLGKLPRPGRHRYKTQLEKGSSSGGLAHKMQNDANVQEVPPKRKSQVYKMSADIHSSCTHVVPRCITVHIVLDSLLDLSYLFFCIVLIRVVVVMGQVGPVKRSPAKPRSSA